MDALSRFAAILAKGGNVYGFLFILLGDMSGFRLVQLTIKKPGKFEENKACFV